VDHPKDYSLFGLGLPGIMEILGTLGHHETSRHSPSLPKVQRTDRLRWDPQTASSATLKTTRRSKPALVSVRFVTEDRSNRAVLFFGEGSVTTKNI